MRITAYQPEYIGQVVELSLRAWAPVFEAVQQVMDAAVYDILHPDWRVSQAKAVIDACSNNEAAIFVALENDELPIGFIVVVFHEKDKMGEVYMIAVDPDYQNQGVGAALMHTATESMRSRGMAVALVRTGGDSGHAPARHLYERSGYSPLPTVSYFKEL